MITPTRNMTKAQIGVERRGKNGKPLDRLTRDALAAEAAGMSYGQYKALHPHTGEDYDEPKPTVLGPGMREGVCACCGSKFTMTARTANKKYCSDDCREKVNKANAAARYKSRKGKPAVCPVCGVDFLSDHQRKYCSEECYKEAQRTKDKARREKYKAEGQN